MNYTAQSLVEMSDLRNQLIDRVEVLSKVKALFLIPGIEMIPAKYVAEFYEVSIEAIRQCLNRNREEIEQDGVKTYSSTEIHNALQDVTRVRAVDTTHFAIKIKDDLEYIMHHARTTYYSPRAVLRIGMLLRDSEVAKEVRTQLLNTFECATPEQKIESIDEEKNMLVNIIYAESPEKMAIALREYRNFMNRHIEKLECEKQGLQTELDIVHNEIVTWTPKQITGKLIGSIGYRLGRRPDYAWNELRSLLYNHHGISLQGRKRNSSKPFIAFVRDNEWTVVLQEVYALAKKYGVDVVKSVGQINAEQIPGFEG